MPSVQADSAASLQFLPGQADSYGSSVIFKVESRLNGVRSRGEYVFGVGENFSRAVLEHKIRPSSNLRATFSSTLGSTQIGGLGGLILRLRSDGHQQVRRASIPHAMSRSFVVMLLRRSMLEYAHARILGSMVQFILYVVLLASLCVTPLERRSVTIVPCAAARMCGSMQVACVGPTGTISHARALRHIFGWRYPTVNVLEFSDMDSGDVAYTDDLLQVYALTNPAIDWAPPTLESAAAYCVASGANAHAIGTDHVAPQQADGRAPAVGTAAASLQSSRPDTQAAGTHGEGARKHVQAAAVPATPSISAGGSSADDGVSSNTSAEKAAADTTSEDCSSSDDTDDSTSQASQGARFAAVDALFRSGAPSADVFSALRPPKRSWQQTSDAASQPGASKLCSVASARPPASASAQAALAAVPARPAAKAARRTNAAAAHSSASAAAAFTCVPGLRVSGRDVPVVAVRDASGSIGKVARGAAAFLVHIKAQDVWLLVSCPCEVRNAFAPD